MADDEFQRQVYSRSRSPKALIRDAIMDEAERLALQVIQPIVRSIINREADVIAGSVTADLDDRQRTQVAEELKDVVIRHIKQHGLKIGK